MHRTIPPKSLVCEEGLLESPLGEALRRRLPLGEVRERIEPADYGSFAPGQLVLTAHRGAFVKPCPGTPSYNCCGLQIIHFGLGCWLDCSYCILQGYLETRNLVLFGNLEKGLEELRTVLDQPDRPHKRYCTGEWTDSLLLEDYTGLGRKLVGIFAGRQGVSLELKTKTDNIRPLLGLNHGGRTIISFSVNSPQVSAVEERRAPSLKRRLAAAAEAVKDGYRVGFHFDPLVRTPGWREGYARTVDDIFTAVPADRVAWISLGCFRYLPRHKSVMSRLHPESGLTDEEFILAPDGKMRYPRPWRVEMYSHLLECIRSAAPEACVYFCMESPRVWREVFGFDPGTEGLTARLDARV